MATNIGTIPPKLLQYMSMDNIAAELSTEELVKIGGEVVKNIENDEQSRYKWKKQYDEALKIAKQVVEAKNTPWPNAASVKYPLITEACIQYNARTNPEVVQEDKVVSVKVMVKDDTGDMQERATRLSQYMSYQLIEETKNWRSDTDKLLMVLPLVGTVFRKSYYDSIDNKPAVDFCLPVDIIVNNKISSLENAQRITHVLTLTTNDIWERMKAGLFTEHKIQELNESTNSAGSDDSGVNGDNPESTNLEDENSVYEQHTFLDLDDDGYKEPYIITVHKSSQKVLRIVARYDEESFRFNKKTGDFIKINAIQYFTDYHFIPSPDGSYLSMGFGSLLLPINASINTILNQLLDAATLSNRGGGFVARAARLRKEEMKFKIGEFKEVNVPVGTTLAQSIYPLPAKEPSMTLFNLLGTLIKAGKELASVSDILQGQSPGVNTAATTTLAMVEQGLKVYGAMLHRLYYSFKSEFEKLYRINKKFFPEYEDSMVATKSGTITYDDFTDTSFGIFPVANPKAGSDAQRLLQSQFLMSIIEVPGVDKYEILHRVLSAHNIPSIDKVLPPPPPPGTPPPPPSPQEQLMMEKMNAEVHLAEIQPNLEMMDRELKAIELDIKERQVQVDAAYKGIQGTSSKIKSVTTLAEADHMMGIGAMAAAQKQEEQMEAPIGGSNNDIHLRLQALESAFQQPLGQEQPQGQEEVPPGLEEQSPPSPEMLGELPIGAEAGAPTIMPNLPQGEEVQGQQIETPPQEQ